MNIADSIRKSLFFTGAGASIDAGCKTSTEMLHDLKKEVCDQSSEYFSDIEKDTIKFLFSCLQYHSEWRTLEINNKYGISPNIEEIALLIRRIKNRENFLPYPVTGNWADKLVSLEARYQDNEGKSSGDSLFDRLGTTIKDELLPKWLEIKNTDFLSPIDKLFEDNPHNDFIMDIATLNNDLVIESHFSEKNARPYRGFYSGEWRGFDNLTTRESEFNRINLYKLHGSLDWVRRSDGYIFERGENSTLQAQDDIKYDHNPFIIFGHGTKFFSVDPFFNLIQKMNALLSEKTYYVIIGYSFFDPYINNLFFQSVMKSAEANKKIIIVNPSLGGDSLKGYFKTHPQFGEILDIDNSDAKRTLIQFLQDIQRNSFYSEIPEFNITQIPSESIYYIKSKTHPFLEKFFSNSGELFVELIEYFENERKEGLPFKDN